MRKPTDNEVADHFYDEDWKWFKKHYGIRPKNSMEAEQIVEASKYEKSVVDTGGKAYVNQGKPVDGKKPGIVTYYDAQGHYRWKHASKKGAIYGTEKRRKRKTKGSSQASWG